MNAMIFYALTGIGLFTLGLYALIVHAHLLRKILAINIMGSGVFLVLVALAARNQVWLLILCHTRWSSQGLWLRYLLPL